MTRRSLGSAVAEDAGHSGATRPWSDSGHDHRSELRRCLLRAGVAVVGALSSLGPADGGAVADPVELGRQVGLLREALAAVEATVGGDRVVSRRVAVAG